MKIHKFIRLVVLPAIIMAYVMPVKAQDASAVKVFADKNSSYVTYAMSHPLHSFEATSKEINSVIVWNKSSKNIISVAVLIKVSSFDSKNANRDSHMIEATEGIKYPQVSFSSTSITAEGTNLKVNGNLLFHGVTRPITFQPTQKVNGNEVTVTGNFEIKLTDYTVVPPSLMGMSCKDLVKFTFSVKYVLP